MKFSQLPTISLLTAPWCERMHEKVKISGNEEGRLHQFSAFGIPHECMGQVSGVIVFILLYMVETKSSVILSEVAQVENGCEKRR